MAGDTINQILVGDGVYYPYSCANNAYIKCNGVRNVNCVRFIGTTIPHKTMYCVSGCDPIPCENDYLEVWDGTTWNLVGTGTQSCNSYGYIYWNWTLYTGTAGQLFRHRMNGTTKEFYVNWFYVTIHTHNYADIPISNVSVSWSCTDGTSGTGTSNGNGEVILLVPSGYNVTYSTIPFVSGCDVFAPEICSKTISNITTDTSSIMKHYASNNCINANGSMIVTGGTLLPCNTGLWNTGTGGTTIKVTSIDSGHTQALVDVHRPWDAAGIFGVTDVVVYEHSWSPTWTNSGMSVSFYVGDIWWGGGGELQWIKVYAFCYANRAGMDSGVIDKSVIFVDCANGNDSNSGLCSFANALKTIGAAQTIVATNGTIYIKYGNCTNEILNTVLNPIVDNVTLSPRQDNSTEGTGTVVIDGT